MQNVNFKSLGEFFDYLPQHELEILEALRDLIFSCIPDATEKLSYNVPFYYRHSRICFLWPSSVSWGNVTQEGTVRLGFSKGYLMRDEINYLDKARRKQVYWKDFSDIQEIDFDILKVYLYEAGFIDEISRK